MSREIKSAGSYVVTRLHCKYTQKLLIKVIKLEQNVSTVFTNMAVMQLFVVGVSSPTYCRILKFYAVISLQENMQLLFLQSFM